MDVVGMFAPTHVPEMFIRGSVMYLMIYAMLRVLTRRQLGTTGVTNILMIVLLADAAQNGMADDYTSITDGLVLVATIVGWSVLLDLMGYFWPWFAKLAKPPPVTLVADGRPIWRHLRRELMTDEELWTQLREHGVHDLREVRLAVIEPDGRVSVLTNERSSSESPPEPRAK